MMTSLYKTDTAENQQSIIEKMIRHNWLVQWRFRGTGYILSAVEESTEWVNVQYDSEEDVLILNLYEDTENGDLDIVSWVNTMIRTVGTCVVHYWNNYYCHGDSPE